MKIFNTNILLLAGLAPLLAGFLSGCEKLSSPGAAINISVVAEGTKSAVTTTSSLEKAGQFVLNAYLDDESYDYSTNPKTPVSQAYITSTDANVHMSANKWTITGEPEWVAETWTRFWCWYPATADGRTITAKDPTSSGYAESRDKLEFKYTAPSSTNTADADNSNDLIFAYAAKKYDSETGTDEVDIHFYHALSMITFCVSTDDGTFDKNLTIKNIKLSGLNNYGEAVFTGNGSGSGAYTWSNRSGSSAFGQDYDACFSSDAPEGWESSSYTSSGHTYNLYTCTNAFFLIPQQLTSSAKITIQFEDGVNVIDPIVKDLGTDEWKAGYYYKYKIKATTLGRDIDASVSLMSWSDRDEKIFI